MYLYIVCVWTRYFCKGPLPLCFGSSTYIMLTNYQLFPILQVVDIYTQLFTRYLYASNRVPISGYHGHNGEQFAQ